MFQSYEELDSVKIKLDILIERTGSEFVPWHIIEDNSEIPGDYDCWSNDIGCIETNVWPLDDLANPKTAKVGDCFYLKGDAKIEFSRRWTDYGWEYDAALTWEDMDIKKVDIPIE